MPLLIKNIGTGLYGSYVLLMTGIGLFHGISSLGIGFHFKRFMPSAQDIVKRRDLFYPQFLLILFSVGVFSIPLLISNTSIKSIFFKDEANFSMVLVVLILIARVFSSQANSYFRYTHRMKYFTFASTSQPYLMIFFISVFIFFFHKKTLNFLLLAYLFSLLINAVPLLVKICKEIGFRFPTLRMRNTIEDIRLGFPLVLSYIVDFILSGSDRYVIAFFMSTTAVGYYSPAYTLGSIIILFPKVFGVVLHPLISRATDHGEEKEIKVLVDYSIKFFSSYCHSLYYWKLCVQQTSAHYFSQ